MPISVYDAICEASRKPHLLLRRVGPSPFRYVLELCGLGLYYVFNIEIWIHLKIIPYCVCVLCVVFNWRHELAFRFSLVWNGYFIAVFVYQYLLSSSSLKQPQQRRHCFLYRLNHTVHRRGLRSAELWLQHAVSVRAGVGGLLEGSVKELLLPSTSWSLFYGFKKCVECKSPSSAALLLLQGNALTDEGFRADTHL